MTYHEPDGYKIRNQSATHFLTFTVMGWVDIFSRQRYRDILINSMNYCREKKGLKINAYVIMSNHLHLIWTASRNNLSDIIRDYKTFTSNTIIHSIKNDSESRRDWLIYLFNYYANGSGKNEFFRLWTGNNHPEEIYSPAFLKTKLDYIHNNPVKAGIVRHANQYIYSSAGDYEGNKGLLRIDCLY